MWATLTAGNKLWMCPVTGQRWEQLNVMQIWRGALATNGSEDCRVHVICLLFLEPDSPALGLSMRAHTHCFYLYLVWCAAYICCWILYTNSLPSQCFTLEAQKLICCQMEWDACGTHITMGTSIEVTSVGHLIVQWLASYEPSFSSSCHTCTQTHKKATHVATVTPTCQSMR